MLEQFEGDSFDVLILVSSTFDTEDMNALELLDVISSRSPMTRILFFTEPEDIRSAMTALKAGTYHYARLERRGRRAETVLLETALEKRPSYGVNLFLESKKPEAGFDKLIGRSPAMRSVYRQIRQAATTMPVLLLGISRRAPYNKLKKHHIS